MLIAHLSDLHLTGTGDVAWLERQLARIAARTPAHLAVTGDLLDRWDPPLLARCLQALAAQGFLHGERLTLLHGNHDLASSGGHPRRASDLWRLALRFWDPPPLVAYRRRRFHAALAAGAAGVGGPAPFLKTLASGARIAVLDTVPAPWRPLRLDRGAVIVQHAIGGVSRQQTAWLGRLRGPSPLVLLLHHFPLDTLQFTWTPDRHDFRPVVARALRTLVREVRVPMSIAAADRERLWEAAAAAGVRLVLCGHVHRARLEWRNGIAVGLNGQSGAAWAGRTIAFYELDDRSVTATFEPLAG